MERNQNILSILYIRAKIYAVVAAAILLSSPSLVAGTDPARNILPIPQPDFSGEIRDDMTASTAMSYEPIKAPSGAPNIFLFMADDVGFSMSSTFGGPVPTPNMDEIAKRGVRYNRFHTTGVCSPSRAALLTGRNAHRVGTGHISNLSAGYPGYNAHFPSSAATIAQTLRLNGYNTAMFGKHHNIPPGQSSDAGPFDMWPTGLGFEYFFGFPHGESDQLHTNVYRGTDRLLAPAGHPELFEKRMADDSIHWIRNHIAAAPGKPFFIYYSPGSTHAPHQAPPELIEKYKGKFDQGWDKLREETWQRQLDEGIIPSNARLTPRPPEIAAWDSLTGIERDYALRGMEVAAAMLAYQDQQLGRIMDELDRTGILKDTLVVIIQGDNGASGDGDRAGLTDEMFAMNFIKENEKDLARNIDKLGGEFSHGSYAEGWGWSMNTPFPWYKSRAGMLGALRDGMIIDWPGRIDQPGTVCDRFSHLVDIAPTLFDAAGVPVPESVFGVQQMSLDGVSLLDSIKRCNAGEPRTQYFEVGGKAGLYSDGWMISTNNSALGIMQQDKQGIHDPTSWHLYDLNSDFSQSTDVTSQYPERRDALYALWRKEAARNNVFPIRSGFIPVKTQDEPRKRYEFWGNDVSIPAHPNGLMGHQLNGSFVLEANLNLPKPNATGVVIALGSRFAGWSLFLDEGRPVFVFARSIKQQDVTRVTATQTIGSGNVKLNIHFQATGPGRPAQIEIRSDRRLLARGEITSNFLLPLGVGEHFDAGRDTGVPVTEYSTEQGALEGKIEQVWIEYD